MKSVIKLVVGLGIICSLPIQVYGVQTNGQIGLQPNQNEKPILNPLNPEEKLTVIDNLNSSNYQDHGKQGILTIDFASNFQMGSHEASKETEVVKVSDQKALTKSRQEIMIPNFVQVTDTRGTNGGWQLTVKQLRQFTTDSKEYPELTGAVLSLNNGACSAPTADQLWSVEQQDLTIGQEHLVMKAKPGTGGGTNLYFWKNQGVSLTIPGNSPKLAQVYQTSLLWSILDAPQ